MLCAKLPAAALSLSQAYVRACASVRASACVRACVLLSVRVHVCVWERLGEKREAIRQGGHDPAAGVWIDQA
jgi:hypothetical protein